MPDLIAAGSAYFLMIETGKLSGSLEKSGQVPDRWLQSWMTSCICVETITIPSSQFPFCMQMYVMLENWQQLTPETAMELLDYQYADIKVRDFAVDCLEVLPWV